MGNYNYTNRTAMTSAERQKKYREDLKSSGFVMLQVQVTIEEREMLKECFENVGGPSWTYFLRKSLIKGAIFSRNSGSGKKMIRTKGGYVMGQRSASLHGNKEARGNS